MILVLRAMWREAPKFETGQDKTKKRSREIRERRGDALLWRRNQDEHSSSSQQVKDQLTSQPVCHEAAV